MLQTLHRGIQTEDISRKAQNKIREKIFETELAYCLFQNPKEIVKKVEEFKPEEGSDLEYRVELTLNFLRLSTRIPKEFEEEVVPQFLQVCKEGIRKIPRNEIFYRLFHHLSLELKIMACFHFYDFSDSGKDEDNLHLGLERFKIAITRILKPLIKENAGMDEEEQVFATNMRITDFLNCFEERGIFYEDKFYNLYSDFDPQEILMACKQLVVEIQKSRFGIPFFNTSETLASNKQRTKILEKLAKQEELEEDVEEEMEEPVKKKLVKRVTNVTSKRVSTTTTPSTTSTSKMEQDDDVEEDDENEGQKQKRTKKNTPEHEADAIWNETNSSTSKRATSTSNGNAKAGGAGRARFTMEEDEALRAAVKKHGHGRWAQILADPEFSEVFNSVKQRSAVNLKDRWRCLIK